MNDEQAGSLQPEPPSESSAEIPLLEQARQIERDMYQIMTTQARLATAQVVLAILGILTALIIASLN